MARKLERIQASIIADIQAQPELTTSLTSNSRRAIWRLFAFVQASAILLLEQIIDVFKAENEAKIAQGIPATTTWLTKRSYDFQYSSDTPQIVQLVNFAPVYPIINASLKIITRCSVVTTLSNQVIVKVAKSEPPVALTSPEIVSFQAYINTIGIAGINYVCQSYDADRIYIDAEIYYDGQFSTVIEASVNAAVNNFLASLPFNGQLKISDLEIAIRNVLGVNDVLIKNVKARDNGTAFIDGTFLVQNNAVISRLFPTIAGYVVLEDSVSNNLVFIAN